MHDLQFATVQVLKGQGVGETQLAVVRGIFEHCTEFALQRWSRSIQLSEVTPHLCGGFTDYLTSARGR